MGAPKQKWTAEEEAALMAGIRKHGAGKWRTILTDTEFSSILCLRSNVDLKDKWRNINAMANGLGSRRARPAVKRIQSSSNHVANKLALSLVPQSDEEVIDVTPLVISDGATQTVVTKEPIQRLGDLILEAITTLKEPSGSDKDAITSYIEETYSSPPNLKKQLSEKLKILTSNGKLVKVKHKYSVAPTPSLSDVRPTPNLSEVKRSSPLSLVERNPQGSSNSGNGEVKRLSKLQIDSELSRMMGMTAPEAAEAAARAVAEAEAAIAEAEEAAREAEAAEAEAEKAQLIAKAARKALKKLKYGRT